MSCHHNSRSRQPDDWPGLARSTAAAAAAGAILCPTRLTRQNNARRSSRNIWRYRSFFVYTTSRRTAEPIHVIVVRVRFTSGACCCPLARSPACLLGSLSGQVETEVTQQVTIKVIRRRILSTAGHGKPCRAVTTSGWAERRGQ